MQAYAAVTVAPRQVEYLPVTVPDPFPDDVVLRVTHSWISNGTEGSFIRAERISGETPLQEIDPRPFPHVSGYQKVGVVEWVGANVSDIAAGETVFATVSRIEGMFYSHGGHITPAVSNSSQIWKVPAGLDPVAVSGLVLTRVGYTVGKFPSLQAGDAAIVIGDGMVGHWSAQTLRQKGAKVLLLGKHADRLGRFTLHAGDRTLNANEEDPVSVIRDWSQNGIQVLADTVGSIITIQQLLPLMRHDSHISSAGFYGTEGTIDLQHLRPAEITLHFPSGWSRPRMDATLALLQQGALETLSLITHRFPIQQAHEAFELVLSRQSPVLGVVLDW